MQLGTIHYEKKCKYMQQLGVEHAGDSVGSTATVTGMRVLFLGTWCPRMNSVFISAGFWVHLGTYNLLRKKAVI
jgi:hypothetical protein